MTETDPTKAVAFVGPATATPLAAGRVLRTVADAVVAKRHGDGARLTISDLVMAYNAQIPRLAVDEPELSFSVINARPSYADAVTTLTKLGDHWVDLDGNDVGAFASLSDVEVLRVGIGPEPLAAWETELLAQQDRREIAAAVLGAMDVDQYLIDAVVNARPR